MHRVDIEFLPENQLMSGQIEERWELHAENVPCHIDSVSGGEQIRGVFIEAGTSTMVEFRYRTDIKAKMRLKYGARYLNVVSARDPEEMGRRLVCQCNEQEQ